MKAVSIAIVALLLGSPAAFAEVHVTMDNGRVTIVAKDATVRQILTEWARLGQTKGWNVEKIPGAPLTLELSTMPEEEALDVLLRAVSGYLAAPRAAAVANLSRFDRIVVMPTSVAPRPAVASASPATPSPAYPQPQFVPPPQPTVDDDVDDERPAPVVPVPPPMPNPRGPIFNPPPTRPGTEVAPQVMPQVVIPQQQQPTPTVYPTAPFGGVAVPGMIVQPQQQPGQPGVVVPGQPGVPTQPVRRPG